MALQRSILSSRILSIRPISPSNGIQRNMTYAWSTDFTTDPFNDKWYSRAQFCGFLLPRGPRLQICVEL